MSVILNCKSKGNQKLLEKIKNDFNLIIENISDDVLIKLAVESIPWYQSFGNEVLAEVDLSLDVVLSESHDSEVIKNIQDVEDILEEKTEHDPINDINIEDTSNVPVDDSDINKYSTDVKGLIEKYRTLENNFHTAKNELINTQKELLEYTNVLEDKENVIKILKKQLKDKTFCKKEEIEKYENDIEELENKNKKLKGENRNITKELNSIKNDLCDFEKNIEQKEIKIKTLKKQLRGCVSEEENDKHLKDLEDLKKMHSEVNKEKSNLSSECDGLKKLIEITELKVKELETELTKKDINIKELESKSSVFEKDIKERTELIEKKEHAITLMKAKVLSIQSTSSNECLKCKELERELHNSTLEMEQIERKVENYKDSLDKKYEECDLQRNYIAKCKEELESLKRQKFNESIKIQYLKPRTIPRTCNTTVQATVNEQPKEKKPQYPDWWQLHMSQMKIH